MRLLRLLLPLHLASAGFFGWSAWRLYAESRQLTGWQARSELALAVAAALLALLSVRALVGLVLAAPRHAAHGRRPLGDYLAALGAILALGFVAIRALGAPGRPALAAFCAGLAAWVLVLTFDLLPRLLIGERRVADALGRGAALSRLEWFEILPAAGLAWLRLGERDRVRFAARVLPGDARRAREVLLERGLRERRQG